MKRLYFTCTLRYHDTARSPNVGANEFSVQNAVPVSFKILSNYSLFVGSFIPPSRFGWPRSISSDFHSMGHVIHEGEANSDADSTTAGSPPLINPEDPNIEGNNFAFLFDFHRNVSYCVALETLYLLRFERSFRSILDPDVSTLG